ncbi:MAG: hypothetical protein M3455_08940, partial [Actinomycetota bacterium]|nr:hypothetical protein [Actinomycetota bacterium]
MTFLPSLPDSAKLLDVFRAYPDTARPLVDYHEALMRGLSPLTVAERELVAGVTKPAYPITETLTPV